MRVLRGSLISQRDPQNNDEIGDPGSPISWGPQNFMTDFRDPVVIIGTPLSTQTADDTGDAYDSVSLQVKNGQV